MHGEVDLSRSVAILETREKRATKEESRVKEQLFLISQERVHLKEHRVEVKC